MSDIQFEPVIGLEVHAQISTDSKIFCGCQARPASVNQKTSDLVANSFVCPVCAGHPGSLPVLNGKALRLAILTGLATDCTINLKSIFARKNYFYPDLPKGYQISQYEQPLCSAGKVPISSKRSIRLNRIHMEEDAGKNIHMAGHSLVNLNRAGVPLMEIVSEPDIQSATEAADYLRALHAIVTYVGSCDGDMEEGNFRCDANVSVRPIGETKLGTRTEIKNVNSFRFVEKAIEFEIARQTEVLRSGGRVVQETRSYDSAKNTTASMRSKEEAEDYRYFPDPDLVDIQLNQSDVDEIRSALPELPLARKERYQEEFGLKEQDAVVITQNKEVADFFEKTVGDLKGDKKATQVCANLITGEVLRLLKESGQSQLPDTLGASALAEVTSFYMKDKISSGSAKVVIQELWKSGGEAAEIVKAKGLEQDSSTESLEPIIDDVLSKNPEQVKEFQAGKTKVMSFFVGQVMKATRGQANPVLVNRLLDEKMRKRS